VTGHTVSQMGTWMQRLAVIWAVFEITDSVENRTMTMNAVYSGIVPDTFDNHAEVVATGRLVGDTFHIDPDGIMAKCPSKYEEQPSVGEAAGGYVSGTGTAGAGN